MAGTVGATGPGGERVRRSSWSPEPDCAVSHALGVLGEGWNLLVVRDVLRGYQRFDELVDSLHISRKVLAERLRQLVADGVLERSPYQDGPTRYAYRLTPRGRALAPLLVTLQDWGDRWLLGDGELSATSDEDAAAAHRLRNLVGTRIPPVALPSTTGAVLDVVDPIADRTVLFGYPATGTTNPLPDGWADIPGAPGCTLENRLFREAYPEFAAAGAAVRGVSTQRPDEQRAFAAAEEIPYPLLSDEGLDLVAALRLPTFRAADVVRVKRFMLVVGADRVVSAARFPITDIPSAVRWSLDEIRSARTTPAAPSPA